MSSVNNFSKVANTVVSAQQILNALSNESRATLNFMGRTASAVPIDNTAATVALTSDNLIQAAVSTLPVSSTVSTELLLGPDASSQAQAYINLFNIRSTNEVRVLRLTANALGAAATVKLRNNNSTLNKVIVALDGTAGANALLFDQAVAVGTASAGKVGSERIVLFSASNLNSGSQTVTFNVTSLSS
jgi:hypothetical protein